MSEARIIKQPISRKELAKIAEKQFGVFVKAVVDIEQGIMAIGAELHADEEVALMEQEHAERSSTWGINLYPENAGDGFIEFDSMINIKPAFGNRSRGVDDATVQAKIREVVGKLVVEQ